MCMWLYVCLTYRYICVYIYMYICMYIYSYIYIYIYIKAHTYAYISKYTHSYTCTHARTHARTHTHTPLIHAVFLDLFMCKTTQFPPSAYFGLYNLTPATQYTCLLTQWDISNFFLPEDWYTMTHSVARECVMWYKSLTSHVFVLHVQRGLVHTSASRCHCSDSRDVSCYI